MTKNNILIIVSVILLLALVNGFTSQRAGGVKANSSIIGATSVDDPAGVRIESVNPVGYASRFGLRKGDIVLKINNQTVKGTASFLKLMSDVAQESEVNIQILRNGVEMTVGRESAEGSGAGSVNMFDALNQRLSERGDR